MKTLSYTATLDAASAPRRITLVNAPGVAALHWVDAIAMVGSPEERWLLGARIPMLTVLASTDRHGSFQGTAEPARAGATPISFTLQ